MLKINQSEINLGSLKFGVPKQFKYTLTNTSSTDIEITRLAVGCMSCTTASSSKNVVKPGENVDINVIFTPGSAGIANKSLSVIYNKTTEIKLKFKAIVHV